MTWTSARIAGLVLGGLVALGVLGCGDQKAEPGAADSKAKADELPDGLTPEQAAKVVARVGDREITVGDVTRQINRLSPYIRRRWSAPEKRKEFVEKLIRAELLAQEAERQGLADDADVQRVVKEVMIRLMVQNDLEKNLLPTSVDEKLLRESYDKEIDKYRRPPQVRGSQIVVKTKAEAVKLIADLKAHPPQGGPDRLFREKATSLSIDKESKERGGDLGYFSRPNERRDDEPLVPAPVAEAVWAIANVGDVGDEPVETPAGFHVVRLTNRKPEMNRSFDSVKRLIENRLLRDLRKEAMDKFVADLKQKAKIEIFAENLDKVKIEAPAGHNHGTPSSDMPVQSMPTGAPLTPPSPTAQPAPAAPLPAAAPRS